MNTVTDVEFDFAGALELARELYALGLWLDGAGSERRAAADDALAAWNGPHGEEFANQVGIEETETGRVRSALTVEALDWTQAWSDAMNEQNRRNRQRRVDAISAARGVAERTADRFLGDDSDEIIADLEFIPVPSSPDFWPTGSLQQF